MNFQQKVLQATDRLRIQTTALGAAAYASALEGTELALKRAARLKDSAATLTHAGRELNKVARVHTLRFIKENAQLARGARKDLSALARTTLVMLNGRPVAPAKSTRKRRSVKRTSKSKAA